MPIETNNVVERAVVTDDEVERVAKIIDPVWMNPPEGPHVLENYPGQADKYREKARDIARSAIASMPTVVTGEQQGWQPIESAPRDEDIYILAMRAGALVPFVASYDADFDNWYTFNGALENCGSKFEPTHWQPLPEPPAQPRDAQ